MPVELVPDLDIGTLEGAVDPSLMFTTLASILLKGPIEKAVQLDIRIVRHKRGRHCVLAYDLCSADGKMIGEYIGKVFGKRRRAERLYRVLEALQDHLGSTTPAPLPIAYIKPYALVLMNKIQGRPLVPILAGENETAARDATRLTARALAAMHTTPIDEGKSGTLEYEIESAHKHANEQRHNGPELAGEGDRLLELIEELSHRLPAPPAPLLTHGGFRPNAVIVDQHRASIFDLDGWAIGDPALDLGYYVADLWWESQKVGHANLRRYGDYFLDQYLAESDAGGLGERALMYEGFTYVRMMLQKLRAIGRGHDLAATTEQAIMLLDQAKTRLALAGA
jgi:aminoglycoside phosphotransferase (APT) family kinase protein